MLILRFNWVAVIVLIWMIFMVMIVIIIVVIMTKLIVLMRRVIVLSGWGKLGAHSLRWLLRLANRGTTTRIPCAIPAPIDLRGFGATPSFAVRWIDRVAAPVAVAALGDIRNDQFVINPAPEWPALGLPLFDPALSRHYTGTGRTRTIGGRRRLYDRNRRPAARTRRAFGPRGP
jgi:hypothetical protein